MKRWGEDEHRRIRSTGSGVTYEDLEVARAEADLSLPGKMELFTL